MDVCGNGAPTQCPTIAQLAILFHATPPRAIGFRGKLSLRYPPCQVCLWTAIGHFYRKKWGCGSDSLRYHKSDRGIATPVLR